jgi:hypothetical protein
MGYGHLNALAERHMSAQGIGPREFGIALGALAAIRAVGEQSRR